MQIRKTVYSSSQGKLLIYKQAYSSSTTSSETAMCLLSKYICFTDLNVFFLLVWSVHGATLMLLLVLREHGTEEVAPATHSVSDEVKLLRFRLSPLHCQSIHTGH